MFYWPKTNGWKTVRSLFITRQKPELRTIAELRRYVERPIKLIAVDEVEFNELLAKAYERDSSHTHQMVQDLDEISDFSSIADAISPTDDLLDQEDDAPVIRLINALLAEAIQKNASSTYRNISPTGFFISHCGGFEKLRDWRRHVQHAGVRIKVWQQTCRKTNPSGRTNVVADRGRELDVRVL